MPAAPTTPRTPATHSLRRRRARVTARIVVGLSAMLISCRGGPMLPSAIGPEPGRTIPLRVSGGITRGSQFATVRDRTSGADPGGSDRSSGTDPVLGGLDDPSWDAQNRVLDLKTWLIRLSSCLAFGEGCEHRCCSSRLLWDHPAERSLGPSLGFSLKGCPSIAKHGLASVLGEWNFQMC